MIEIHLSLWIAFLLASLIGGLYLGFLAGKSLSESLLTKHWSAGDWAAYRDWKQVTKNSKLSIVSYVTEKLHFSEAARLVFQNQLAEINRQRFGADSFKSTKSIVEKKDVSSRRSTDTLNNVIRFPTSD